MASSKKGYYGDFGGRFVPETLIAALQELEDCYLQSLKDKDFARELDGYMQNYIGRATPLFYAKRLSEHVGGNRKIYLKREDLCHTGAHKINNALGQVMLARRMGKKRVIAETGAGQHGVATATAAALFGMECDVYMGEVDMARQKPNVDRMYLLGARVIPVTSGSRTLKDAINDAFRDWVATVKNTHYVLGTVHGAHPFPMIVRDYQSVIGKEALKQIKKAEGRLPDLLVASVGGGSNAIGLFHAFRKFKEVEMVGVEAGGEGIASGRHAARFTAGTPGILHGAKTYLLQDKHGQVTETYSVSAGLDYPAVGPEHALMFTEGRVKYTYAKDREVLNAFNLLSRLEGIIPALESSHALAYTLKRAKKMSNNSLIIVNLSGRGDKDMGIIEEYKGMKTKI